MESFSKIRRRTTDLLQNVQQNLPAMPSINSHVKSPSKDGLQGTWERISIPPLPRSSHSLDIVSGSAYVFGGEVNPREPVDNDMHVITLPWSSAGADYYNIKAAAAKRDEPTVETEETLVDTVQKDLSEVSLSEPTKPKGKERATDEPTALDEVPAPRVGHATAVIGTRIFMFGGRGGPDMVPLEEAGRVWVFDTRSHTWTHLDPVPVITGGAIILHPAPRSYHCATATERPRDFGHLRPNKPQNWRQWAVGDTSKTGIPQDPIIGNVAEDAVDEESAGYGTFFIHGGCLADGTRTNDIWAFNVHSRTWTELPAAPGPARGGSAICISKSRLFRFGGYDGETELGEQLDFLDLEVETFDDKTTVGEVSIHARGGWQSIIQNNKDASSTEIPSESFQAWPEPRSVAFLEALTLGGGREYLVLGMGERHPSSEGHAGAGKFFDDVWTFQVPPQGMSAASVTDGLLQAMGRKTSEGRWIKVDTLPYDDDNDDTEPAQRGWLASAPMGELQENGIVIWGGLGEDNNRLGDGWILRLGGE